MPVKVEPSLAQQPAEGDLEEIGQGLSSHFGRFLLSLKDTNHTCTFYESKACGQCHSEDQRP